MLEFTCADIWSWAFVERFFIIVLISMLVIGLLRFCMSPGSVLEGYTFLRIHPFLLSCPFYWHIVADSSLYDPLYFCVVCCDFSVFISIFVDLILLFFIFLMSVANGFTILFIFSKNQLLLFFCFFVFCCSLLSFSIISALIF